MIILFHSSIKSEYQSLAHACAETKTHGFVTFYMSLEFRCHLFSYFIMTTLLPLIFLPILFIILLLTHIELNYHFVREKGT